MKRLGVCVYPEITGVAKTIDYIKCAFEHGVRRVFSNLLELKNNDEGKKRLDEFATVYKYANNLGMEMILDVNPEFYKEFNLPKNELLFFKNLGATGIRLDEDFAGIIESELSNNKLNMMIELNASAGSATFEAAIKNGANPAQLMACHNFYPMQYTALDQNRFIELSKYYKLNNIRVAAFITLPKEQKGVGPWNVNDGMPTLEAHREMSLEDQFVDMLSMRLVDDIIISQQGATAEQFIKLDEIFKIYEKYKDDTELTIPIVFEKNVTDIEKDIVLNNKGKIHTNRPDFNTYFYRSSFPRIDYKDEKIEENNTGKKLELGDVVILNKNFGRYKGEMHIIWKEIDDSKVKGRNLVAKVKFENIEMLKLIKYKKVKFKEVN